MKKTNKNTAQKIDDNQLAQVQGGFESCVYAGVEYKHGTVLEMPGGPRECRTGTWMPVSR